MPAKVWRENAESTWFEVDVDHLAAALVDRAAARRRPAHDIAALHARFSVQAAAEELREWINGAWYAERATSVSLNQVAGAGGEN
jgi:hypothetical protein